MNEESPTYGNASAFNRRTFLIASTACAVGAAGYSLTSARELNQHYVPVVPRLPFDESLRVAFCTRRIGSVDIFYREVGPRNGPTILLLHGFPSASHMFRNLFPLLATRYHLIAPDLPGFGNSRPLSADDYTYSYENIVNTMADFISALKLDKLSIYGFDYGCSIAFKLAMMYPDKVNTLIGQNGNLYKEGLGASLSPWQAYWESPTAHNREVCATSLLPENIRKQHYGADTESGQLPPDGYNLDNYYLSLPRARDIQLDLIRDYKNLLTDYPTVQKYLSDKRPPLLIIWGRHDTFFSLFGVEAYVRNMPHSEVRLLDTGRFVLETHARETAGFIRDFMDRSLVADATYTSPIRVKNDLFFDARKE
ncbi:alpha/beta hydrolase [Pseudomonas sp. RC10]|uniref:alpha/beta fold hydrolase n=1 Tax=Pseudomonas bambusae TaxID=3139142 RepID=UPI003139B171